MSAILPHQPENPRRLDRLSALLQAVAPRIILGVPDDLGQMLRVELLASTGEPPHSVAICPAHEVAANTPKTSTGPEGGGDTANTAALTMHVQLQGPAARVVLREFAQPMVLPLANADAALVQAVQLLCSEMAAPRCGQPAMLASAGHMLFIGLLRQLVAHPRDNRGLFAGLNDPRIAVSLVAMHEQPQGAWTLESLAERAGMSRTAFATRFKNSMGVSPGKYLAQLRLLIAQRAVQAGKGLKSAARDSGYQNVSALSRALGRARAAG